MPDLGNDFSSSDFQLGRTITIRLGKAFNPKTGKLEPASELGIDGENISLSLADDILETVGSWAGEVYCESIAKGVDDPKSPFFEQPLEDAVSIHAIGFVTRSTTPYVDGFLESVQRSFPDLDLHSPEAFVAALKF